MKLNIALLFAYVSVLITFVQAGRYDKNRKAGMKTGVLPLHKYIRDSDDPNQGGFDLRSARLGRINSYNDLPDIW